MHSIAFPHQYIYADITLIAQLKYQGTKLGKIQWEDQIHEMIILRDRKCN